MQNNDFIKNKYNKSICMLIFILFISLFLYGCNMENLEQEYRDGVTIHIDKETGCEYLINSNSGGMTPRYEVIKGKYVVKGCKTGLSL